MKRALHHVSCARKALGRKFPVNFSPAEVRPNLYGVD
jgi:hypothetical protein